MYKEKNVNRQNCTWRDTIVHKGKCKWRKNVHRGKSKWTNMCTQNGWTGVTLYTLLPLYGGA